MVLIPVRYSFSQRFSVPVEKSFTWSLDYDPNDFVLMGLDGRRKIKKLADDTFILEDTRRTERGLVKKTRLIRVNHARRAFTNTHIAGPTPYSQFWYEFFPEKDGESRLDFTGYSYCRARRSLPGKRSPRLPMRREGATLTSGRTSPGRWKLT